MSPISPIRAPEPASKRKRVIFATAVGVLLLLAVIISQVSFDLNFLRPDNNQQIIVFSSLSLLIFLLFVALTFVLGRNLLKLFAERRLGVLGSKFRTRLVVVSLLLSFLPVIVMFWFAYGVMNHSIERWFSTPVEEVRRDTAAMASLLADYAAANAHAEALALAKSPEAEYAFDGHSFTGMVSLFRRHEITLQNGFAFAIQDGEAQASFNAPAPYPILRSILPTQLPSPGPPVRFSFEQTDYILGSAPVGDHGLILVALPLPKEFSETEKQVEASQKQYLELAAQRKLVRRTYMGLLLLLTALVLFATTWLALFLSKLVTRPVVALAEATQEISRGRLDYRVEVSAADEIGDLVRSFNRMAEELESGSRKLSAANLTLDQRRRHIETILESIPTGVLSIDASRHITHVNYALFRLFRPKGGESGAPGLLIGAPLADIFPSEILEDLEPLLRRADRMGTTTVQMEMDLPSDKLNVAVTVSTLQHQDQQLGYVLVFEDLSDLLKAQKQAAWREVARRVAHEIKNPLTPIGLSAERIRRHLDRNAVPDEGSVQVIRGCAETIASSVETVRTLVDEFSTLARFPASQPQPADVNSIVLSTLAMFSGRLEGISVRTELASGLPAVMADPEALKRALANLVDNAAEAVQDCSVREVEVSTSLLGDRDAIEVSVADSGHGVTQELKERLFLPYFSTKKRGTGLGLAIVSRIIEDHRGSIRVEENKPAGARFIVELPLAPELVSPPVLSHHA